MNRRWESPDAGFLLAGYGPGRRALPLRFTRRESAMRFQELFGKTLRDAPGDAEMVSHQLAIRAGLVRPLPSRPPIVKG